MDRKHRVRHSLDCLDKMALDKINQPKNYKILFLLVNDKIFRGSTNCEIIQYKTETRNQQTFFAFPLPKIDSVKL